MSLDSLKQQIRQMQALQINGSYVLNTSQRNILDDVLKLVGDLEKSHIIKSKEEIEELFEGVEVYYESKEIKEWIQTLKKILLGDKK